MSARSFDVLPALEQQRAFSLPYVARLQRKWNATNTDVKAYVPADVKRQISDEQAIAGNEQFGVDASFFQLGRFRESLDYLKSLGFASRLGKKFVYAGWGQGYDHLSLEYSLETWLEPMVVDVSSVACGLANEAVRKLLLSAQERGVPTAHIETLRKQGKVVCHTEIRYALNQGQINPDEVHFWSFVRFLNTLSDKFKRIVLQGSGQSLAAHNDPNKMREIWVIGALREKNKEVKSNPRKMPSEQNILKHISIGAERPVWVVKNCDFDYFNKRVTALAIKAR